MFFNTGMTSSTAFTVGIDQKAHSVWCGGIASSKPSRTNLLSLRVESWSMKAWVSGVAICMSSGEGIMIANCSSVPFGMKTTDQNQHSPNHAVLTSNSPKASIFEQDLSNAFLASQTTSFLRSLTVGVLNSSVHFDGGAYFVMDDLCRFAVESLHDSIRMKDFSSDRSHTTNP